ncbi:MAG: hypothetical protein BA872_07060 [Desulfobacterales bacterium C00003060]|nr:MAG: hypothetical protein BA872_07060 [Desulfobacterales bacterium C00003060]
MLNLSACGHARAGQIDQISPKSEREICQVIFARALSDVIANKNDKLIPSVQFDLTGAFFEVAMRCWFLQLPWENGEGDMLFAN